MNGYKGIFWATLLVSIVAFGTYVVFRLKSAQQAIIEKPVIEGAELFWIGAIAGNPCSPA